MEKYICIHGHFYQPPRENPWLESVELQDSARPYHDWNERITAECYAPNATARILNGEHKISEIISNYSKISFNFGATLLAWMKDKAPEVHEAIVESDRASRERFSGHGSALAQVYNHMILPLANQADKHTQVLWGIRDFEHRFGRKPEGMWLAETAADTATLSALAEQGIKFTVLSPFQASRTREVGKRHWRDVNGGQIDPTRSYLAKLPSGKSIALFFYDAPVSQAVAFEHLLDSGERLAHRLLGAFNEKRTWDQLVHIATDGESYGHHHKQGEMALAYALQYIENNHLARLTIYGEYLEKHPPTHEVQIHEPSSWSCVHGVGRWMTDCGCNTGRAGWNQAWRTPLRQSLDWLRDEMAPLYEAKTREYLKDPWEARNDYISVILDRSHPNRDAWFAKHALRPLPPEAQVTVLKLMELQRHAMLMYTSCGWFFDEISGLESVQVVQYAARAMQLARELFDKDFEPGFLERFEQAKSNLPENRDGRFIYQQFVKPAMLDRTRAMAHYAISSTFQQYGKKTRVFSYTFTDEHRERLISGKTRLAMGRATVTSEITQETECMAYAILYMGEHNLTGGVRRFTSPEAYDLMVREVKAPYEAADFPETIRAIDRHFGDAPYSLRSLFKDEQRRIMDEILQFTREDLETRFRLITERYTPLMKFLQTTGTPLPQALQMVSDLVLHSSIRKSLWEEEPDLDQLRTVFDEARAHGTRVLDEEMSYSIALRLEESIRAVAANPADLAKLKLLRDLTQIVVPLPLNLNLAKVQNAYWRMLQNQAPEFIQRAETQDQNATAWLDHFRTLGEALGFAPPPLTGTPALKAAA